MIGRLVALVVPLGIDSFVVAAAVGLGHLTRRQQLRVSTLFATFEAGMPLIGLVIGRPLGSALGHVAEYLAIGVLIAFGAFTVIHGDDGGDADIQRLAASSARGAALLGISVSLDELAIGFTLGLLRLPVLPVVIAIAVQAFLVSQLGLRLGGRLSERLREAGEKLAGLVLVGLGVALLVEALAT